MSKEGNKNSIVHSLLEDNKQNERPIMEYAVKITSEELAIASLADWDHDKVIGPNNILIVYF